jgi:hypothetical protein
MDGNDDMYLVVVKTVGLDGNDDMYGGSEDSGS